MGVILSADHHIIWTSNGHFIHTYTGLPVPPLTAIVSDQTLAINQMSLQDLNTNTFSDDALQLPKFGLETLSE